MKLIGIKKHDVHKWAYLFLNLVLLQPVVTYGSVKRVLYISRQE